MKIKLASALAIALLSTQAMSATLDFEGVSSDASINDFYNGGTDIPANNTTTPASGINYGISFGGDALAVLNTIPGFEVFSNAPGSATQFGGTVMAAVGPSAALNVAAGFTGTASFYYSSTDVTTVDVWSGIDGTGSVLATFNLLGNAQSGCSDTAFCHWDQASVTFAGLAKSIQFSNTIGLAGFDNVTVAPVPLPAAAWLLFSGLGSLGVFARRKRNG